MPFRAIPPPVLMRRQTYQTSSHHPLAEQDRLGQSRGHHLVAIDQWQEESQVLLWPAQVVAQRRPPLVAIRRQGILKVRLLQSLLDRIRGEDCAPDVGINVLPAGRIKPA